MRNFKNLLTHVATAFRLLGLVSNKLDENLNFLNEKTGQFQIEDISKTYDFYCEKIVSRNRLDGACPFRSVTVS